MLVKSTLCYASFYISDKGPRCRLTNNEGPKSFTPCIFPFIIQESVQLNECTSIGDPVKIFTNHICFILS